MPGSRKLGRASDHRLSMLRGMVTYLLEKGKIETAKKMLDKGMDVQTISELTGISEAKIKSLAKKPTKKAA